MEYYNTDLVFDNIFQDCERIGDTCCNYTSCTLNEGAQCADGACCSDCQVRSSAVNNKIMPLKKLY
jgi:hypothetical protein